MLNIRTAAIIAAGTVLCVAPMAGGTAHAAAAPAAVTQDRGVAAMEDWVGRTAAWGQNYSNLVSRRADTIAWLTEGPTALAAKLQAPDKGRAREWVTGWAAEARSRLAADMDVYRSLPIELPRPTADTPLTPDFRRRLEGLGRLAERTGTLMISTGQAAEEYIQLMEAAASGEQDDLVRLDAGFYKLTIAHLQAETTMIQAFEENASSPAREFAQVQIEVNDAIIVWSRYQSDVYLGTADGATTAELLRGHSRQMQTLVANLRSQVNITESRFRREPEILATPFGQTMLRVVNSMRDSAGVEERIGVALGDLAEAAAKDDQVAGQAVADRISALVSERLQQDAARRQMLLGAQS
jgi:hypothetical protein